MVYIQRECVPSMHGGTAALEPCSCKPLTTCTCFCEAVYQWRRVVWFSSNCALPVSEPEHIPPASHTQLSSFTNVWGAAAHCALLPSRLAVVAALTLEPSGVPSGVLSVLSTSCKRRSKR